MNENPPKPMGGVEARERLPDRAAPVSGDDALAPERRRRAGACSEDRPAPKKFRNGKRLLCWSGMGAAAAAVLLLPFPAPHPASSGTEAASTASDPSFSGPCAKMTSLDPGISVEPNGSGGSLFSASAGHADPSAPDGVAARPVPGPIPDAPRWTSEYKREFIHNLRLGLEGHDPGMDAIHAGWRAIDGMALGQWDDYVAMAKGYVARCEKMQAKAVASLILSDVLRNIGRLREAVEYFGLFAHCLAVQDASAAPGGTPAEILDDPGYMGRLSWEFKVELYDLYYGKNKDRFYILLLIDEMLSRKLTDEMAARAMFIQARCFMEMGERTTAVKLHEGLLEKFPDQPVSWRGQIEASAILFNLGRIDSAIEKAVRVYDHSPFGQERVYGIYHAVELSVAKPDKWVPAPVPRIRQCLALYPDSEKAENLRLS